MSHPKRTPEVVRGCRIRNGAVLCCVSMLCSVMTACHRLRGGIMGAPIGGPRMSPTPRSAKYGVTHGANHLPGLEKCPPLVVVSAGGGGVGASLRH